MSGACRVGCCSQVEQDDGRLTTPPSGRSLAPAACLAACRPASAAQQSGAASRSAERCRLLLAVTYTAPLPAPSPPPAAACSAGRRCRSRAARWADPSPPEHDAAHNTLEQRCPPAPASHAASPGRLLTAAGWRLAWPVLVDCLLQINNASPLLQKDPTKPNGRNPSLHLNLFQRPAAAQLDEPWRHSPMSGPVMPPFWREWNAHRQNDPL